MWIHEGTYSMRIIWYVDTYSMRIHLKHVAEYSLFAKQQCKFRNLASLPENNLMVEDSRCTTIIVHL